MNELSHNFIGPYVCLPEHKFIELVALRNLAQTEFNKEEVESANRWVQLKQAIVFQDISMSEAMDMLRRGYPLYFATSLVSQRR